MGGDKSLYKEKLVQKSLKSGVSKIKDPSSGALGVPNAVWDE